jgi:DNA mismatch repair ATPase MutS
MRHPILELSKDSFESFVPNDIKIDEKNVLVIYGANSSGKSTILKGLALNIIMAQMGCYVSAEIATLTVFESIMTRMTTYDSISEGLSTFTMEMIELQNALKKSNEKSLFLFDEIGRGTCVEDGEAIAFGIIDFLNSKDISAITLFATHYHALYENIKDFKNVEVKHFHCEVINSNLIFTRELQSGPGSGSYGLAVAETCGVPKSIIRVSENYKKKWSPLIVSRYNSSVQGTLCELCKVNDAQETHHIIDQLQGKIKAVTIKGIERSINDEKNLVLLCGNCHKRVTKEKSIIRKKRVLGSNNYLVDIEPTSTIKKKT